MPYSNVKEYFASFPRMTRLLFGFIFVDLFFFSIYTYRHKNAEFFYYSVIIFIVFLLVVFNYHKLHLTEWLIAGFALHMLLHFLGGTVYINGTRLYDLTLIPVNQWIFHFDNLVHAFGVFLLTFLAYNLLRPHFKLEQKSSLFPFALLLFLIVMGIGACSEVVELGAVLWLNAANTVGDYYNNAFDLVMNGLGALLACLVISWLEYRRINGKGIRRRKNNYVMENNSAPNH